MNTFQVCDSSDLVPLYLPQQLYLKPIAKLNISLQLPKVVKNGKSISHLEIMEKIRELIKPEQFTTLKVTKTTLEFVRFEAEIKSKKQIERIVDKVNNKTIKLKNFSELMRLKAKEFKSDFPTRHVWDDFFDEAKDMNQMKAGERPDTIFLSNLPIKWFAHYSHYNEEDLKPSEKIMFKVFEKFGPIRYVDIPICDPYRTKMKDHISGIKNKAEDNIFFEGYVQFKDYLGFTKCMDSLKDMDLVHKESEENFKVPIKVDFDRSKHLSDASIRRREIVRDRLVKKQAEKEEQERNELEELKKQEEQEKMKEESLKKQKEQRRKLREERRKARALEKLKLGGTEELNAKIAKEEKKLLKVQRKLESIRLLEELFRRIREKKDTETGSSYDMQEENHRSNEFKRFKNMSELEVLNQKEKLHNTLKGRAMLKTILQKNQELDLSSSSSDEMSKNNTQNQRFSRKDHMNMGPLLPDSFFYGYPSEGFAFGNNYNPLDRYIPRGHPAYNLYSNRGRRYQNYPGPSRGFNPRRGRRFGSRRGNHDRNVLPRELEEEYIKYFTKLVQRESKRRSRSYSRSRSRSYSRHRSYSRSRSRSPSRRRRSRTRSRSYSRKHSRSWSRSKSRGRSRKSHSRSRTKSPQGSSKDKSKHSSHRSNNSKRSRTPSPKRRSSFSKSKRRLSKDRSTSRNRSVSKERRRTVSVNSSEFISPRRMRRSKSWSMPRDGDSKRSWSKSPEK